MKKINNINELKLYLKDVGYINIEKKLKDAYIYMLLYKNKILTKNRNHTHSIFWMDRGYSEEEAKHIIRTLCNKSTIEYWMDRGYSEEEAIEFRKSYIFGKEQYKRLGYTDEKINKMLKEHSKLCKLNFKKNWKREYNNLTNEYWINKGYSEEEARLKIIEQNHNRMKYDEKWKNKVSKSLKKTNKTEKRKEQIETQSKLHSIRMKKKNKTHSPIFREYWINKGYSEEEAKRKQIEVKYLSGNPKGNQYCSKKEAEFIHELESALGIKITNNKFLSVNGNVYCPDGRYNNFIIEFNGTKPHLDSRFFNETDNTPWGIPYNKKHKMDEIKYKNLSTKYTVIVIWEWDFDNRKDIILNKIKDIINEDYKKGVIYDSASF